MNFKTIFLGMTTLLLVACGRSDAEIKNDLAEEFKLYKGVTFDVKEGVVTISSRPTDEEMKQQIQNKVEGIKGIKGIVNNCKVFHTEEIQESQIPLAHKTPPRNYKPQFVEIKSEYDLNVAIYDVLTAYNGVNALVTTDAITLTGTIKKEQLPDLMKSIKQLTKRKIENKLSVR